jgi:predicted phosphoribosyltransferase
MSYDSWFERSAALFRDRIDAGRQLALALRDYAGREDVIVLALPRGGVPVGYEVAMALKAELDVLIVRKLGYPGNEEFAVGAIASGGVTVLNEQVQLSPSVIESIVDNEMRELQRREEAYRGNRPAPALSGRCVILVDDGLATGSTMRAAIAAVRDKHPQRIVVAVPVAPPGTVARLQHQADDFVCLHTPDDFHGIGQFYVDFSQTTDGLVRRLLEQAWTQHLTDSRPVAEMTRLRE